MSSPTPDEQCANVRHDVPAHVRSATSEMTAETPRTSSETFLAISVSDVAPDVFTGV